MAPVANVRNAITFRPLGASMRPAPMPGVGKWFAGAPTSSTSLVMLCTDRDSNSPPMNTCTAKEFVGDHVTMEVREAVSNYGDIIVRARYYGTYDKTNLPDELIMSSYFSIRDNKIVSLTVIFNQPSPY